MNTDKSGVPLHELILYMGYDLTAKLMGQEDKDKTFILSGYHKESNGVWIYTDDSKNESNLLNDVFPLVRPISEMTEEEANELYNIILGNPFKKYKTVLTKKSNPKTGEFWYFQIDCDLNVNSITVDPFGDIDTYSEDEDNKCTPTSNQINGYTYLLSKHFDVFGWLNKEIALNKN